MGYSQSVVTVLESTGVAQLTVTTSKPASGVPIETSFHFLVHIFDETATGLPWSGVGKQHSSTLLELSCSSSHV